MSKRRTVILILLSLGAFGARFGCRHRASILGRDMTRQQIEALVVDVAPDFKDHLPAVARMRGLSVRIEEPWRRWVVLELGSPDDVDLLKRSVIAGAEAAAKRAPKSTLWVSDKDWPSYLDGAMPAPAWWNVHDLPDCDVLRVSLGGGQEDGWAFSRRWRRAYLISRQ